MVKWNSAWRKLMSLNLRLNLMLVYLRFLLFLRHINQSIDLLSKVLMLLVLLYNLLELILRRHLLVQWVRTACSIMALLIASSTLYIVILLLLNFNTFFLSYRHFLTIGRFVTTFTTLMTGILFLKFFLDL